MVLVDQIGNQLLFKSVPRRIVSLVPSQTELLVDLGLEDQIVGVTKFCVHPESIRKNKKIVGGTKQIHYERIDKLQPDVILCNKEENTKEIVETLSKKYTVHVSDIFTLQDSFEMIRQYGQIFNVESNANELVDSIKDRFHSFKQEIAGRPSKKVGYFIWKKPWMAAGKNTFIDHLLELNGFINFYGDQNRYPEIKEDQLSNSELDFIFLSSEPFPFADKHVEELKPFISENTEVKLVDGEYFSWYGSRLLEAFDYFKKLL